MGFDDEGDDVPHCFSRESGVFHFIDCLLCIQTTRCTVIGSLNSTCRDYKMRVAETKVCSSLSGSFAL